MHSYIRKEKAKILRKQGYSYSHIAKNLSVSKSTLSLWLRDVSFVPNKLTVSSIEKGQKQIVEAKRFDKMVSIHRATNYAEESIGDISNRDIFLLGLGIYMGEGSKTANSIRVANADPRIIKFAIKWLKTSFGLTDENFKVRIHVYSDNKIGKVMKYWKKQTGLAKKQFYDCYVDIRANKSSKKKNILPYGTAHLSVVSKGDKNLGVLLHRKILATIDRVLG